MSRVGRQPVQIPNGVTVDIKDHLVTIKGPKGELRREFHPDMKIEVKDNVLTVARSQDTKENRALHGLTRNIMVNMIHGVGKGFEKRLEIIGIGYRAQAAKNKITLTLGFSHPVEYTAPQGIEFKMDEENKNIIIITGIDKEIVGETAAKVRSYRKPEPYKGKGIRYLGEYVPKKAGKAAASAAGGGAASAS
ncbi:50S ribosomal protein L6 [Candidatus Peregrinibacteria bacterium]|nr:50S ribosomal protein L6 [Candidatus Peregrinibacteria bacterium]